MKRDAALDRDLLIDRAQALARTIESITELEREMKDSAAAYKESLANLRKEATRLARVVRTGIEEIECEGPLIELAEGTNNEPEQPQTKTKRRQTQ